jgi:CheY-like chemotaxis protein
MDGYEVCKRLKAGESTARSLSSLITAKSDEESREREAPLMPRPSSPAFDAMTVLQVVKTHLWLVHGE